MSVSNKTNYNKSKEYWKIKIIIIIIIIINFIFLIFSTKTRTGGFESHVLLHQGQSLVKQCRLKDLLVRLGVTRV